MPAFSGFPHRQTGDSEKIFDLPQNLFVQHQCFPGRGGHCLLGKVIAGRPKPSGCDQDIAAGQCLLHRRTEPLRIVAHCTGKQKIDPISDIARATCVASVLIVWPSSNSVPTAIISAFTKPLPFNIGCSARRRIRVFNIVQAFLYQCINLQCAFRFFHNLKRRPCPRMTRRKYRTTVLIRFD